MYAVIETGSKQYIVEKGTTVHVEKLGAKQGSKVTFGNVLLVGGDGKPKIGAPYVQGAKVTGEVLKEGRDRKVMVFHKKRRKGYEKKYGHRQPYTEVMITAISP